MRIKGQFSLPVVPRRIARTWGFFTHRPARATPGGGCAIEGQGTAFPAVMAPDAKPIPRPEVWMPRSERHTQPLKRVAAARGTGQLASRRSPALATVLATEMNQGRAHRDMPQGRNPANSPPSNNIGKWVPTLCRHTARRRDVGGMTDPTCLTLSPGATAGNNACSVPVCAPVRDWLCGEGPGRSSPASERTPFRSKLIPVLRGRRTSARSGVADARSICALA